MLFYLLMDTSLETLDPVETPLQDAAEKNPFNNADSIQYYRNSNRFGLLPEEKKAFGRILKHGGKCLDIGCGTGREAFPLIAAGLSVVGIDFASRVIFTAQSEAKGLGIKLPLIIGDACNLMFKEKVFDSCILPNTLIQFLTTQNRRKALKEIKRILKDDGLLIIQVDNRSHYFDFPYAASGFIDAICLAKQWIFDRKTSWLYHTRLARRLREPKAEQLFVTCLESVSLAIFSFFIDGKRKLWQKLPLKILRGPQPYERNMSKNLGIKPLQRLPFQFYCTANVRNDVDACGLHLVDLQSDWELIFDDRLPSFLRTHAPITYYFLKNPSSHLTDALTKAVFLLKEELSRNEILNITTVGNSMKPVLLAGDKLSAKRIRPSKLQPGDMIIFPRNDELLVHRIISFRENGGVMTKGDNVKAIDESVSQDLILAKIFQIDTGLFQINCQNPWWRITNRLLAHLSFWEAKNQFNLFLSPLIGILKVCAYLACPPLLRLYFRTKNPKTIGQEILKLLSDTHNFDINQLILDQLTKDYRQWKYFLSLTLYNNMGPLLYKNLTKNYLPNDRLFSIPQWVIDSLETSYRHSAQKSAGFEIDFARLLNAFHENNIKVIVLKGAALVGEIYPESALRPMEDLDLLVTKQDWPMIKDILEKEGFRNKEGMDLLKLEEAASIPMNRHIAYTNERGLKLELNFRLLTLDFPASFESREYFENARRQKIAGVEAYTLSLEDHFLYMASRMINVGFRYYLWFHDLKEFLYRYPQIDWALVVTKAKEKRLDVILYYTLRVLKEKLHTGPIAEPILQQLSPRPWKRRLLDFLFGYRQMGFRRPTKNGKHFHPAIHACFFLHKFGMTPKGLWNLTRYFYKIMFPPAGYLCYRYGISKRQATLGVGTWHRLKPLFSKLYQWPAMIFNRY